VSSPLPLVVASDPRAADRHLVARCLDGDGTAERALYDAHVERIYRLMHRMAGTATSRRISRRRPSFARSSGSSSFAASHRSPPGLHTIAVSVAPNGMRKVKRLRVRTDGMDSIGNCPPRSAARRD
jgi:RNA polymerase sigma-70 factor (ECF subfamily)